MICPHCGKQTANTSLCDHCGCSTEFAKRTNYQSVGTSCNEIKCPSVPKPEPIQKQPAQNNRIHPKVDPPIPPMQESPRTQTSCQTQQPPIQGRQSAYYPYPEQKMYSIQQSKIERLVPWLAGAVVILLLVCIIEGVAFSWLLKKVDRLSDQIASSKYIDIDEDTREIPTTETILETLPDENEGEPEVADEMDGTNT